MIVTQAELFKNVGQDALEMVRSYGSERAYESQAVVFREGERAENFYILVDGKVHVVIGEEEEICFAIDRTGQVFGWSALVEPYQYRAGAHCLIPANLVEIPREAIERVLHDYPTDGAIIFRNLAALVTERMYEAYRKTASEADPWR